jgi:hypothetical protein
MKTKGTPSKPKSGAKAGSKPNPKGRRKKIPSWATLPEYSNNPSAQQLLMEEAAELLLKTEFLQDGLRKLPLPPKIDQFQSARNELDFCDLPPHLFKFAAIWEQSRDLEVCYAGGLENGKPSRMNPFVVSDPQFQLLWSWNQHLFPLPIMRLLRTGAFKTDDGSLKSAIFGKAYAAQELAPTLFSHLAYNSEPPRAKIESPNGEMKTISLPVATGDGDPFRFLNYFAGDRWREVLGVGTQGFWNARKLPRTGAEAHVSFHAIVIDWEKGKDAVKKELNAWVERRRNEFRANSDSKAISRKTNQGRKAQDASKHPLSQLAAWRASQLHYQAEDYLSLRVNLAGLDNTVVNQVKETAKPSKDQQDALAKKLRNHTKWPVYQRPDEFLKRCKKAKQQLHSLKNSIRIRPFTEKSNTAS